MRRLVPTILCIGGLLLATACELVNVPGEAEVFELTYDLTSREYEPEDMVRAQLTNNSTHTVYIVRASCRYEGLEKHIDGTWEPLYYKEDLICPAGVKYRPIDSGEVQEITRAYAWFERVTEMTAGNYRFAERVAPSSDADTTAYITSETFAITK
jgi:hypothetical protein